MWANTTRACCARMITTLERGVRPVRCPGCSLQIRKQRSSSLPFTFTTQRRRSIASREPVNADFDGPATSVLCAPSLSWPQLRCHPCNSTRRSDPLGLTSSDGKVLSPELYDTISMILRNNTVPGYSLAIVRPGADIEVEYGTWGNRTEGGDEVTPNVRTLFPRLPHRYSF